MSLGPVLARIDADLENAKLQMLELLRISSISTDPTFDTAAYWLDYQSRAMQPEAQKHQTHGNPMDMDNFTEFSNPDAPHLLFSGDVYVIQPTRSNYVIIIRLNQL